jgi:LTXXQ motif family protein
MKTRNKVLVGSGIILMLLLLAGFGLVSAYGPLGGPCGGFDPRFHGRGFFPGGHGRDMADFILWRMDKKAQELKLTPVQKEKYEVIKENLKTHFAESLRDRQKMKDRFQKEMSKEDPNVKDLAESLKTKIKDHSDFVNQNLDLLVAFYDSLDSRQKRLIHDEIRERMKTHHQS